MIEPDIRRVVIACDAQGNFDVVAREAAILAARWRVPLHGIFLRDENLLRLAGLPFTREVSLSAPEVSGPLEVDELQQLLSVLAASMRRTIEGAAKREGIDWSFAELRDLPSAASSAAAEGDILVIDAGTRPFSGSWRPRSPWEDTAGDLGAIVLLRRNKGGERPCIAIVLDGSIADHERTLGTARALTTPEDQVHVLTLGGTVAGFPGAPVDQVELTGLPEVSAERPCRDLTDVLNDINRLNPRLVVIETSTLEQEDVQTFVAATRCDMLLIAKAWSLGD